jgi:hypothetical protein
VESRKAWHTYGSRGMRACVDGRDDQLTVSAQSGSCQDRTCVCSALAILDTARSVANHTALLVCSPLSANTCACARARARARACASFFAPTEPFTGTTRHRPHSTRSRPFHLGSLSHTRTVLYGLRVNHCFGLLRFPPCGRLLSSTSHPMPVAGPPTSPA